MKTTFLVCCLLWFSLPAWACSCVSERISEKAKISKEYEQAALVFTGRLVRAEPITTTDTAHVRSLVSGQDTVITSRRAAVRYTFAVIQLIKGQQTGTEVQVISDNTSCGVNLAVGTERLMYAYAVTEDANPRGAVKKVAPYYATDVCSRHQQLRYTRGSELRQLRRLAQKG
ncbi:hypothetical protein [Hymenobacter arizonensis]|uniref:Tissue inhibitor of metalloproteinase n=1 Tax=Hymenobacter arizonensis TaxID=1227077 RepID=A0A1I5ZAN1_HYMAR|nr:hypothetical protein [Hymenobacter arizonensis]SFQ53524.1 hypothetical protein SAMN04515668_2884 [Hymenobacter arizonensis]